MWGCPFPPFASVADRWAQQTHTPLYISSTPSVKHFSFDKRDILVFCSDGLQSSLEAQGVPDQDVDISRWGGFPGCWCCIIGSVAYSVFTLRVYPRSATQHIWTEGMLKLNSHMIWIFTNLQPTVIATKLLLVVVVPLPTFFSLGHFGWCLLLHVIGLSVTALSLGKRARPTTPFFVVIFFPLWKRQKIRPELSLSSNSSPRSISLTLSTNVIRPGYPF